LGYLTLTACTPPATSSQQATAFLSGDELRVQVVDHTLASATKRGYQYTMHIDGGGTGVFVYEKRMGLTDVPLTWEIQDNVFCFHSTIASECNKVRSNNGKLDFVNSSTGILSNTYSL
jgi:hypothetical protein